MAQEKKQTLTEKVKLDLRARIEANEYEVGTKLPKEKDLISMLGVSRTVVREALAQLSAEGLLEIKHGVGAFVTSPQNGEQSRGLFDHKFETVAEILELFELRLGIEIEASGLAAVRRSPAQDAAIREAFQAWKSSLETGENTGALDFEMHLRIAEATNNRFYAEFLQFMTDKSSEKFEQIRFSGRVAIKLNRTEQLIEEHKQIIDAITLQQPEKAREAMREHLKGSEHRFRELSLQI
ncbi:FadR family transcriptional regulator [Rhodobacteraceae bacterium RKSG542]|uniref:FadR/GntR family transcriptional regulator n=1 Tax=Pseudovibrio flavus TaxID=2529854 RepID=UPI0012BD4D42|nr:FadR/GntR family transcriptional regulator [Pseudovibrio flavus]MTI18157.1 FadR family transcriptional regulator [Pseudovibrio flavus]